MLAVVAVGNDGDLDRESGNARIQSPADCVNALGIGACDSASADWRRADYSSIGPGRSPGIVKPDAVSFGGTDTNPFWVLGPAPAVVLPTKGTSFSAPSALRTAVGVRTYLGPVISFLAAKCLLVHLCETNGEEWTDVGWGRVPSSVEKVISYGDGLARIVYQGTLRPGQWLRAEIPVPTGLKGTVEIVATLCTATETDPQDPINYTRSGLEVVFRPDSRRKKSPRQLHPDSRPFFRGIGPYATEQELRADARKWETVLHGRTNLRAQNLHKPAFDIHYIPRTAGGKASSPTPVPYALIISIRTPKVADLYDRVVREYRTQLEVLRPVIQIPVRAQV